MSNRSIILLSVHVCYVNNWVNFYHVYCKRLLETHDSHCILALAQLHATDTLLTVSLSLSYHVGRRCCRRVVKQYYQCWFLPVSTRGARLLSEQLIVTAGVGVTDRAGVRLLFRRCPWREWLPANRRRRTRRAAACYSLSIDTVRRLITDDIRLIIYCLRCHTVVDGVTAQPRRVILLSLRRDY